MTCQITMMFGCRRSGQHAIHRWWLAHLPKDTYYVENVIHASSLEPILAEKHTALICMEDRTAEQIADALTWIKPHFVHFVVRSIYNVVASRMEKGTAGVLVNERFLEKWKFHAKNHNRILYDRWFSDPRYRRDIERINGLEPNIDGDMDYVPAFNGGSSFDKRRVPGTVLNVLRRYDQVDRAALLNAVDEEAAQLNEAIFGWRL